MLLGTAFFHAGTLFAFLDASKLFGNELWHLDSDQHPSGSPLV
jgi:hypothetical protein